MTRDDDFIGQLRGYLDEYEGMTPLPDPVRNAVRAHLPMTKQLGRFSGPLRRFYAMNMYMKVGLAATAVVLATFIGIQLLDGSNVGGPAPSASVAPSAFAADSAEPSASAATGLPAGSPFILRNAPADGLPIIVTIPGPGWFGALGENVLIKDNNPDLPDGAEMTVFLGPLYVYGDPCLWSTTRPDAPATTVDEFVAAMTAQASRDASAPVDVTVGGFAGKSITVHVPDDAKFLLCDADTFGSWRGVAEGPDRPSRYHQGPGQIDELWILDVNGTLVVIDAGYYARTPAAVVSELRALADSATFAWP